MTRYKLNPSTKTKMQLQASKACPSCRSGMCTPSVSYICKMPLYPFRLCEKKMLEACRLSPVVCVPVAPYLCMASSGKDAAHFWFLSAAVTPLVQSICVCLCPCPRPCPCPCLCIRCASNVEFEYTKCHWNQSSLWTARPWRGGSTQSKLLALVYAGHAYRIPTVYTTQLLWLNSAIINRKQSNGKQFICQWSWIHNAR